MIFLQAGSFGAPSAASFTNFQRQIAVFKTRPHNLIFIPIQAGNFDRMYDRFHGRQRCRLKFSTLSLENLKDQLLIQLGSTAFLGTQNHRGAQLTVRNKNGM